jgi:hypothetical protein
LARELISQREYARRRGISNVAVNRAVKAGRITLVDGKIDPDLADKEWAENTDPSTPKNRVTGKPRQTRNPDEASAPMDLGGETSPSTGYAKARAVREVYNAQNAKLDLDLKRGALVRADEVRIAAFSMARKTRDQLIALPERLSTLLAATEDAAEVHKILEEEIERICLEISGE